MPINKNTADRPHIYMSSPLMATGGFIRDLKPIAANYTQTKRLQGGYWQAQWDIVNTSPQQKIAFFNQRIGSHIEVKHQGTTIWEGMIWSMDLRHQGTLRRISMADARNTVRCDYTNQENERKSTIWYDSSTSIYRYGQIFEVVTLNRVEESTAQAYAQTIRRNLKLPIPNAVSYKEPKPDEETTLNVVAAGYIYTLNFEYVNLSDTPRDIDAAITAVLSASVNDYIQTGTIEANTVEVLPPRQPTKVWDWLLSITEIGDGTDPYIIEVRNDRRLNYKKLSPEPTLKWDGKNYRASSNRPLSGSHYQIDPGIIKDLTWPSVRLPSTHFLRNQQDSIATEAEAGEGYRLPLMKTDQYEDSEFMAAIASNQAELLKWYEKQEEN